MGRDFVFTVPALTDAVRYAVDCLTAPRQDHWEATAILVLATPHVIDAARAISLQRRHGPDEDAR